MTDNNPNRIAAVKPKTVKTLTKKKKKDMQRPMDVSKLNLDFLNILSKGMSNIQPANDNGKFNFSIMIGDTNVNVDNKNVSE